MKKLGKIFTRTMGLCKAKSETTTSCGSRA